MSNSKRKKHFLPDQKQAFVDAANPHQWFLTAENLHSAAQTLWGHRGTDKITRSGSEYPSVTWDETNRATFLLAAFAMENILKAFLVYEDPTVIKEGFLTKITTHDLWSLANCSSHIPYKARDRWVFEALSEGNESWARYPCGRDADHIQPEGEFTIRLWEKYCVMMEVYKKKIKKLLTKGWVGPSGPYGRWKFTDSF
ncbi:hypothetical protein [Acetobacter malorum]|uniref:hypothetical protein n=1 Tax=Acetobacter malorum TaxID=178901 RepID=UPI00248E09C3|nr:hypothetical protein [Acetobacter malorum]